ncbi:hypothetical protein DTO217A2_4817 [Paecilomyces variotii]|nr:hypothetical protein DTO217A2_4817 [Paecilomyces variotii]
MSTARDTQSKLYSIVQENLPDLKTTTIDRKYWSERTGHEYVDRLAFQEDLETIKITLEGNYFAACSLAAVLKYVEVELGMSFSFHSLRIKFEPSQGSMMIDLATVVSLELIQNVQNTKSKDSLFGLLNETLTPMGARLLRSNILQPSTEPRKITGRYEALEELTTNEDMFFSIRQALKNFVDSDRIITSLILIPTKLSFQYAEQCINKVIMLKTYVSSIKPVYDALATAQSELLLNIRDLCDPTRHRAIQELIDATLNEDVTYQTRPLDLRNQRTYAIKAGVNSLLDVARQTYKEANADAVELVSALAEAHNLVLDLKFDPARQYYISMSTAELENGPLPDIFINVFRKKNIIECQTLDLVKLNQKIMDSHNEVVNMSDRSIQELIEDIRSEISVLFKVSEAIAILDMLAAFAQLVTTQDYVRPELTDVLAIKAGRHPIKEKIQSNKFVPNDAYAAQQSRFQIITGCNMSGKSTYIRSLALMTIMAQIGCFVPAQYASFPIVHQLFARVSTTDDIEANMSTFTAEMREMSFILHNIEPRSMVIVDELGRGTSTTDGLAIAIAIAEALVESHALVWFATHFRDLARIMSERSGVVNLHLAVELSPEASKMTMLYRIAEGHVQEKFYGLALAKLVALPPKVLEVAANVSEKLTEIVERRQGSSKAVAIARRRNLILRLKEQLMQAKDGNMEDGALKEWLSKLQEEFILQLAAVDAEFASSEDDEEQEDVEEELISEVSEDANHSTEEMDQGSGSSQRDHRDDCSDLLDDSPGLRGGSSTDNQVEG